MFSTLALANTIGHPAFVHHFGGPFGGFGFLFFLIPLFWIVVIGLIIGFSRRRMRRVWAANGGHPAFGGWGGQGFGGQGFGGSRAAEVTLAERFAQGDIDEQEYRARLEVLRANR